MIPRESVERLLERYQEGQITKRGLVLELLSQSGSRRLSGALEQLPSDILKELKNFVESYRPGINIFRGPIPEAQTVRFVRLWLSRKKEAVLTK